jgi:hypothetical protein
MNRLLAVYILLAGVLIGFHANADVLLEPYVGYDQTAMAITNTGGTDVGGTATGLDYGARLAYRFDPNWWVGGEYALGSGTSKSNVAGTADSNYTKTAMAAVVGYDHGEFRFWGGYGFSDSLTVKATGSETKYTGTNYKLGAGYMVAPKVSVNFEYLVPQHKTFNSGGADADISTAYSKFSATSMALSVSFPFDLDK